MTIEWKTKNVLVAGGASFIGSHLTDALLPLGQEVRGLRLHGWVEQDVLDTWLVKAQAVLVPQQRGFGALTGLCELSCAGVPVITSTHPTYAIDLPPGIWMAQHNWDSWLRAMAQLGDGCMVTLQDYTAWWESQPSALEALVTSGSGVSADGAYAIPNPE